MPGEKFYFSFDVESLSLFGHPFAVGWVIVDDKGKEHESGYLAYPQLFRPMEHEWLIENVLPALPVVSKDEQLKLKGIEWGYRTDYANCLNEFVMVLGFWDAWCAARRKYPGLSMVADCPWPVEAEFLRRVQKEIGFGMEESPYPILDVASVLAACGYDPLKSYPREPAEEPVHNPVCDARQSVRLMLSSMKEAAEARSSAMVHGFYGPLKFTPNATVTFSEVEVDRDKNDVVREFSTKLTDSQKELDADYAEVVEDHFWDLVRSDTTSRVLSHSEEYKCSVCGEHYCHPNHPYCTGTDDRE